MLGIELKIAISVFILLNIFFVVFTWKLPLTSFSKEWRLIIRMSVTGISAGANVMTIAQFLELLGR